MDKLTDYIILYAGVGVIDFAGGCVVHVLGGTSAFLGAFILGPRKGRFGKHSFFMPQQNATFQVLGTLLLWFGWYGFNTGSTLLMHGNTANVAALVAANTTLSASVSGYILWICFVFANFHNPYLCQIFTD